MRSHLRPVAFAGILLSSVAALSACKTAPPVTDSQSFDFSGQKLVIDTREAGLTLVNGAKGKIGVERTRQGNATDKGAATLALEGGTLKLFVECSGVNLGCEGKHTVSVPPGVDIELRGSGSRVNGRDLAGDLTAQLRNDASIALDGPSGALNINANGGGITLNGVKSKQVTAVAAADGNVTLEFATAPDKVEARSTGGYANVTLPAGPETYRVDAPGKDNLATDPGSARTVTVRSSEGRAKVQKSG
ncbi:hypothetical protein JOF53_008222 [Crossiella equi]|uniref:Adhesin domain-containing protein n=1 Tax=Crossiella equi TaxID=130796 RepID=A0ABS5AUH8_9PSEU|nr:DUF4097 family beta strand repeat-containing protein [Crossiella equi]MBP2479350.1 hypothetical protein [Crossiella equi]